MDEIHAGRVGAKIPRGWERIKDIACIEFPIKITRRSSDASVDGYTASMALQKFRHHIGIMGKAWICVNLGLLASSGFGIFKLITFNNILRYECYISQRLRMCTETN